MLLNSCVIDEASAPTLTCSIVTTDAVGDLAEIHNRMPLMLDENDWDRWLNPDEPAPEEPADDEAGGDMLPEDAEAL